MGNSKSRRDDRYLSSHHGKHKIKKEATCPICHFVFPRKTLYSQIDDHIESHSTAEPLIIPEDHRYPKVESKLKSVRVHLSSLRIHWSQAHIEVHISRESLLKDSLSQLLSMNAESLRSEFHIHFTGETSYDAGGLTKEWLSLMILELFSSDLGLFHLTTCENPSYLPVFHNRNIDYYKLFGLILGKAILENIPLNCSLCRILLKHLLGKTCSLRDVKYQDVELYNSLTFMLENNIDGVFFETFSVENAGQVFPLTQDGQDLMVDDSNKMTYVLLRTEYQVYGAFSHAVNAIKEGLFTVIPFEIFKGINYKDLNFLICGNPFVNIKDWMTNTEYAGDFCSSHPVINWFWEVICGFSQENLRKFLQFVTGSSQVPVEGFSKLKTLRGDPAKFKIVPVSADDFPLPRAHTCFNRLDLPKYRNKIVLKQALEEVVNFHLLGFGID